MTSMLNRRLQVGTGGGRREEVGHEETGGASDTEISRPWRPRDRVLLIVRERRRGKQTERQKKRGKNESTQRMRRGARK